MAMKDFVKRSVDAVPYGLLIVAITVFLFGGTIIPTIASGTVTAGFDPTATTTSAIGTVSTFLGVIVPLALGVAVIFWMVRWGSRMFKGSAKAIVWGSLGMLALGSGHVHADPVFGTFAAGYDPTTNFSDAIGLVSTYLGVIVPLVLGVAVIFWMVRWGSKMFKGSAK